MKIKTRNPSLPTPFLFSLIALLAFVNTGANAAQKPNLIVIMTDDQGYADVGFNGCKDIPTPNIDRIASEGVRFTNGYVTYPVCGPSRAGFITGRYQGRFGFRINPSLNPNDDTAGLSLEEETIAEILRKVGYHNGIIGKWHLGTHQKFRPNKRGFDEFYGFVAGGHNYFPEDLIYPDIESVDKFGGWYRTKLRRNDTQIEIEDYLTDELSEEAVDFIGRNSDKPFFLFLSYNAPHTPLQASQKYLDRFEHIKDQKRKTYAAMMSAVDDGVGQVLDKLSDERIEEDTLVFYLSDNGGAGNNGSDNGELRATKGTIYEGGLRVPFALRWPKQVPPGMEFEESVSSLDILATIASITQVEIAPDRPLDGVNLIPYLKGEQEGAPHDFLFWQMAREDNWAIRTGSTKLLSNSKTKSTDLYRLDEDIREEENLIKFHPETAEKLKKKIEDWSSDMKPAAFPGRTSWDPGKGN